MQVKSLETKDMLVNHQFNNTNKKITLVLS